MHHLDIHACGSVALGSPLLAVLYHKSSPSQPDQRQTVTVRPPCQIESGISGLGDLGQDYEDGFQRGVVPKGEIDHMRRHVTRRITSED